MKALFNEQSPATAFRRPNLRIYTGTSVGSYNAAYLASRPGLELPAAIAGLEQVWRQRIAGTPTSCGNGVFQLRGVPGQLLDPACWRHPVRNLLSVSQDALFWARYGVVRGLQFATSSASLSTRIFETVDLSAFFSLAPLESLIGDTILLDGLRAARDTLIVLTSNWQDGTAREFTGTEIADRIGPKAILASTAVPGFFPAVTIEDVPYVDGGVLMTTPMRPAIRAGAEVIHVVYVDPLIQDIPFPRLPDTLDTIYRLYVIMTSQQINRDIEFAAEVNRELDLLAAFGGLEGIRLASVPQSRALRRSIQIAARIEAGQSLRQLTIHRYRPTSSLNGAEGFLDFRIDYIDELIATGYEDAVHHDCEENHCLLPDRQGAGEVRP